MNKKIKNILIDVGLVGVILLLLLIFHSVFIAGPLRAQEHEQDLFVSAFKDQYKLTNVEFLNRFSLDEPYYIIKDSSKIYGFNKNYTKVITSSIKPLSNAEEKAKELGFSSKNIQYGIYEGKIVFSIEDKSHIVFLDLDTLDVLLDFGG